jgi:hypothetical protein
MASAASAVMGLPLSRLWIVMRDTPSMAATCVGVPIDSRMVLYSAAVILQVPRWFDVGVRRVDALPAIIAFGQILNVVCALDKHVFSIVRRAAVNYRALFDFYGVGAGFESCGSQLLRRSPCIAVSGFFSCGGDVVGVHLLLFDLGWPLTGDGERVKRFYGQGNIFFKIILHYGGQRSEGYSGRHAPVLPALDGPARDSGCDGLPDFSDFLIFSAPSIRFLARPNSRLI